MTVNIAVGWQSRVLHLLVVPAVNVYSLSRIAKMKRIHLE